MLQAGYASCQRRPAGVCLELPTWVDPEFKPAPYQGGNLDWRHSGIWTTTPLGMCVCVCLCVGGGGHRSSTNSGAGSGGAAPPLGLAGIVFVSTRVFNL